MGRSGMIGKLTPASVTRAISASALRALRHRETSVAAAAAAAATRRAPVVTIGFEGIDPKTCTCLASTPQTKKMTKVH